MSGYRTFRVTGVSPRCCRWVEFVLVNCVAPAGMVPAAWRGLTGLVPGVFEGLSVGMVVGCGLSLLSWGRVGVAPPLPVTRSVL